MAETKLIRDHHLWTKSTIKNVSGDVTLDIVGDLTLDAGVDVNIPANIGLTFGDDGEKIEGDGTDLNIESSGRLTVHSDGILFLKSDDYTIVEQTLDSATAGISSGLKATFTRTGDISSGLNSITNFTVTTTQTGASGGSHTITGINNTMIGDGGGTVTAYGFKQNFLANPGTSLPDTIIGIQSMHAGGTHMKLLYDISNYSTFTVSSSGDLNMDGAYNVLDIVALSSCILNYNCWATGKACAADMNDDGSFNVLDIVALANCVVASNCYDVEEASTPFPN